MDDGVLSRFGAKYEVCLPNSQERKAIFMLQIDSISRDYHQNQTKNYHELSEEEINLIIERMEGKSGRDIMHLVERAIKKSKKFTYKHKGRWKRTHSGFLIPSEHGDICADIDEIECPDKITFPPLKFEHFEEALMEFERGMSC